MYDAYKHEATNEVFVSGRLNELDVKEYKTSEGKKFVSGYAEILSDQPINGEQTETRTTVRFSAFQLKNDGNPNKVYTTILNYPNQFTSIAAADSPEQASEVTIAKAKIKENLWIDQSGTERSGFQLEGNFMNRKKDGEEEGATFSVTGYIFKMDDETNKDGEPTGRIKLTVGIVGWNGRMNKIEMYAEGAAKAHVEQNWQLKDTVNIVGRVKMINKTETYEEQQGFGEPIKKTRTIFSKELIVTGGSQYGLDEEYSYDEDSIRKSCSDRLAKIEGMKQKAKEKTAKAPAKKTDDYGF